MRYRERRVTLDFSSAGRGLQQNLLLLAYLMTKRSFYVLAEHVPLHELDPEVGEKLDAIAAVAASAMPAET